MLWIADRRQSATRQARRSSHRQVLKPSVVGVCRASTSFRNFLCGPASPETPASRRQHQQRVKAVSHSTSLNRTQDATFLQRNAIQR